VSRLLNPLKSIPVFICIQNPSLKEGLFHADSCSVAVIVSHFHFAILMFVPMSFTKSHSDCVKQEWNARQETSISKSAVGSKRSERQRSCSKHVSKINLSLLLECLNHRLCHPLGRFGQGPLLPAKAVANAARIIVKGVGKTIRAPGKENMGQNMDVEDSVGGGCPLNAIRGRHGTEERKATYELVEDSAKDGLYAFALDFVQAYAVEGRIGIGTVGCCRGEAGRGDRRGPAEYASEAPFWGEVLAEDIGVDGAGRDEGAVMCGLEGWTGLEEEEEVGFECAAACEV
jgi:hypothetical protein